MCDNSDIVLLLLIASLNFSFELKLPGGVGHSPLKSPPCAGAIRQSRLQAAPWVLWQGLSSGSCSCPTWPGQCWPCSGCGEFVTWVEVKSLCPQGQVQDSSSGELLCAAPGRQEGKGSCGAFPLKWHHLILLNL